MTLEPFAVTGNDGLVRRGVLSAPAGTPQAALVLVVAGVKYRTGPGQLYIGLARLLAEQGIATLRFDPAGVGESDGQLEPSPAHLLWRSVERGRFVPDAALAVAALRNRLPCGVPIFLGGLCGGGLTAQLAAAAHPAFVRGVVSINIAVRETRAPGQHQPLASEARAQIRSYPRKLLSPASWRRVFSSTRPSRALIGAFKATFARHHDVPADDLNPLFVDSLARMQAGGTPQLFLFGGGDERWHDFNDLVLSTYLHGKTFGPSHDVRVIPGADHLLSHLRWRHEAATQISAWTRALA